MKKRTWFFLALGAALALLTGTLFSAGRTRAAEDESEPGSAYVLREYNGRIAVFSGPDTEPDTVTDIEVHLLPELDRLALSSGIAAGSRQELTMLLEDLGS